MKRVLLIFCLCLSATLLMAQPKRVAEVKTEEILSKLSEDTIVKYIKHLESYGSRCYINSAKLLASQKWIFETVKRYSDSYEVYLQPIDVPNQWFWGHDMDKNLRDSASNIVVIKRGVVNPDKYVVVGGHFDSFNNDIIYGNFDGNAPGADDDASGTSAVMEMARVLAEYEFDYSMVFCAWNLEEIGLFGSAEFANDAKVKGLDILGYINLDMIGYVKEGGELVTSVDYNTKSKPLFELYKTMVSIYTPDLGVKRMTGMPGGSDHASFHSAGYQAIFPFEDAGVLGRIANVFYHSADDVFGMGVNNMEFAMMIAKSSLATVIDLATDRPNDVEVLEDNGLECSIYPNPVSSEAVISYSVDNDGHVMIRVYDMAGRFVKMVVDEHKGAGEYSVSVGREMFSTGLYNLRINTSNASKTVRFMVR